jgi:hypothetical protein
MNPLHVVNNVVHLPAVKNVVSTNSEVQYVLCFFTIFKNDRAGPLDMKFYPGPELHKNSSKYLRHFNLTVETTMI